MNIKDLRLGNWVTDNLNGDRRLTLKIMGSIDRHYKRDNFGSIEFAPILLTEYWFISAGFKPTPNVKDSYKLRISKGIKLHSYLSKGERMLSIEYGDMLNERIKLPPCQYVHQLQNVYHSLSGRDIEFA